jgi:colicin import membrane protein
MAAALPPNARLSATGRAALHRREEPGRAPAALLAFVVHAGFFALIIFGVSWQVKPPAPIAAELWSTLPATEPVVEPAPTSTPTVTEAPTPPKPPTPTVAPVVPKAPKVEAPSKADIALKAKKERDEKLKKEQDDKKRADEKRKADEDKQRKADEAKRKAADDKARQENEAREAAARGVREAAVRDYMGRIAALIRNRANIPDSVTGQPEVQVRVRLLTNGTVFEAGIARPSGNRAFDESVERAINGIRQWPVPENPEILGRQRELLLNIKHER